MERLLIEMHKKMDVLKTEKQHSDDELKLAHKSFNHIEKELDLTKYE
jgi:hypothetical protein